MKRITHLDHGAIKLAVGGIGIVVTACVATEPCRSAKPLFGIPNASSAGAPVAVRRRSGPPTEVRRQKRTCAHNSFQFRFTVP